MFDYHKHNVGMLPDAKLMQFHWIIEHWPKYRISHIAYQHGHYIVDVRTKSGNEVKRMKLVCHKDDIRDRLELLEGFRVDILDSTWDNLDQIDDPVSRFWSVLSGYY
jgi:hypothetical protein